MANQTPENAASKVNFDKPWKIAFEEHFLTPSFAENLPSGINRGKISKVYEGLMNVGEGRVQLMDEAKIEYSILSLNSPGIQAETSVEQATKQAMLSNDELKAITERFPKRLGGFAALPTQDGTASAKELERSVKELGFHGALINSFANVGDEETPIFLDHPSYDPLWEMAQNLNVPIYLHPRNPLASQQLMFKDHPELLAATWGFLVECSTHALRMVTSGVFDKYPRLTIGLGHLGEALPAYQWRISKTYSQKVPDSKLKKTVYEYLKSNFVYTTSGFFDTKAMLNVADIVGEDRVCFSSDFPWMTMADAAAWFDNAEISDAQKISIGRTNALRIFNLDL